MNRQWHTCTDQWFGLGLLLLGVALLTAGCSDDDSAGADAGPGPDTAVDAESPLPDAAADASTLDNYVILMAHGATTDAEDTHWYNDLDAIIRDPLSEKILERYFARKRSSALRNAQKLDRAGGNAGICA